VELCQDANAKVRQTLITGVGAPQEEGEVSVHDPAKIQQQRLRHRLLVHHGPLLAATAVAVFLLYVTRPYPDVLTRASFATAYPALLVATLLIGPINVLRRRRNPISGDLRRDVGIWAGIVGVGHSVVGQMVHLRGRPWLYYVYEKRQQHLLPFRHDLFGFANYTGLVGAVVLLALMATSNDYSLRALGTPRWKQLQRWNYAGFALAAAHAVAYQTSEKQRFPFVLTVAMGIALAAAVQTAGYLRRRSASVTRPLAG